MRRDRYPLKLPQERKRAAERLAKEDGVSLKQWIPAAMAQKVGVVETAAEFFKKRAGKAKGDGLMRFLRNAPKVAAEAGDEIGRWGHRDEMEPFGLAEESEPQLWPPGRF